MKYLVGIISLVFVLGCEDQITPELPLAPDVMVVDAFINNLDSVQTIKLTWSRPYFENVLAEGIAGAQVSVENSDGRVFLFAENESGKYQWDPIVDGPLGLIGDTLTLSIDVNGMAYSATSQMNRVPDIDSVTFRFEEEDFIFPDSYFAEFWSRDPLGPGDTYWIKSYKNGQFLNQPNEINIAFDAGFSEGGNVDGLIFIPPIRDTINPFEESEDDGFLSPFEDGDSVYVEIYSITREAFDFLNNVRIQTDRPGGFAELFATPLANIRTNVSYLGDDDQGVVVTGFFSVSAVKGAGKRLDTSQVPKPD